MIYDYFIYIFCSCLCFEKEEEKLPIMELKASKTNPPLGAIILAQLAKKDIKISWGQANTEMNIGEGVILRTCSRYVYVCKFRCVL